MFENVDEIIIIKKTQKKLSVNTLLKLVKEMELEEVPFFFIEDEKILILTLLNNEIIA